MRPVVSGICQVREGHVAAATRLKFVYLAYFSQPREDRFLYRSIRRRRIARIVELGMTSLARSRRLIEVAQRYAKSGDVCFAAIDPFESAVDTDPRQGTEKRMLIDVFRTLKPTGACLRLLPGHVSAVVPDVANTLPGTDLVLVAHTVSDAELERVWYYLPRMLHGGSLVIRELISAEQRVSFEPIPLACIHALAALRLRPAA